MTWEQFTDLRKQLAQRAGYKNTLTNLEKLLGVNHNVSASWKQRSVPLYIQNSIEAHLALPEKELQKILNKRDIPPF